MTADGGLVLAHHPIVTALPLLIPTLLIVVAIAVIVWRDRRAARSEDAAVSAPPRRS